MVFDFLINENYVFLHAINGCQKQEPFNGWSDFTNKIWEENPEIFYFLSGSPEYSLYKLDYYEISKKSFNLLEKIKMSLEFKRIIDDVKRYKIFVESQWIANEDFVLKQLSLMGVNINFSDKIKVYLTHPNLNNGLAFDNKAIVWGHKEDFENYSTVYLVHELMHIITENDNSDITHAIIELLADNEVRIRLNQRGTYFEYKNHEHLEQIEKTLFNTWINYLNQKNKDIFKFISEIKKVSD